jgi:phage terminase small subunit
MEIESLQVVTMKKKSKILREDELGLTPKQRSFVRHYLKDYNGTQAAIRTGYSKETARFQASVLLTKPNIQAAIQREEQKLQNRFVAHKDRVLRELAIIGYSNITEFIEVGTDGRISVRPLDSLPPDAAHALKIVKEKSRTVEGRGGKTRLLKRQTEIQLHDKVEALKLMGREIGMFKGNNDTFTKEGDERKPESLTDEELDEIIHNRGDRPAATSVS